MLEVNTLEPPPPRGGLLELSQPKEKLISAFLLSQYAFLGC